MSYPRRPLQRCIDVKFIRDWVPEKDRRRIDIAEAWKIIRVHFCAAVIARGVCPIDCQRCRPEIVDLFRLENTDNPPRLLTWLAKDHSARWIEKLIEEEKRGAFPARETPQDAYDQLFPKRGRENLFELLLRSYEDDER